MPKIETLPYIIPSHYLSFIFNGDQSGLSEQEIILWEQFELNEQSPNGHWSTVPENDPDYDGDQSYFSWSHDMIRTGVLPCDCTNLLWVII